MEVRARALLLRHVAVDGERLVAEALQRLLHTRRLVRVRVRVS